MLVDVTQKKIKIMCELLGKRRYSKRNVNVITMPMSKNRCHSKNDVRSNKGRIFKFNLKSEITFLVKKRIGKPIFLAENDISPLHDPKLQNYWQNDETMYVLTAVTVFSMVTIAVVYSGAYEIKKTEN